MSIPVENDNWAIPEEERNDYEPNKERCQYRVRCPEHGVINLGYTGYSRQMWDADALWKCLCGQTAEWVGILEPCPHCGTLVDYEETGSCDHCGKRIGETYEPEDDFDQFITLDDDEYQSDDEIPF